MVSLAALECQLKEGLHLLPLQQLLQAAHHIQGRGRRRGSQSGGPLLRMPLLQRMLQHMLRRLAVVRGLSRMQQRPCTGILT